MFKLGPYRNKSRVVLAPMAGVSDHAFRERCREFGSYWLVSEMVTSDHRLWQTPKSKARLPHGKESGLSWVQLVGSDPASMAAAARENVYLGADIIDINMGCPAKKVCNKAAGSALLRDEALVAKILKEVVAAVNVPVTLKIRLGWSREQINAVTIAKLAEDVGIALLTVHGRTRACRFRGEVDYEAIAEVCSAVDMPVIANGDITSPERAKEVLEVTGAAGVMVGRAAQGRPWLLAQIDSYLINGYYSPAPQINEVVAMLRRHLVDLYKLYGEYRGVRVARKHVGWTLDWLGFSHIKQQFNRCDCANEQFAFLQSVLLECDAA